ncbi:SDR family NAD(P)-dependent oxidoreductase [Symbioplanes lichenis]|uniref:SDR family NAD(P)-dependent oxidoreductase n=1 Tax=Symbioplanes lichenis TaxID=1629072 RepID=UPI00273A3E49|nr:SDR family NAD(P)-dependent oxidoreductase [Actinoplanes lichenis]
MTTRLAVVTGSSRGLGAALTEHLADQSWNVVACVRSESAAVSIKRAGVEPVLHDVRDPVSEALMAAVHGRPIDALINNAGIGAPARPLEDCDSQTILDAVDVNVAGPMRLTQALLPMLLAAPAPLIINVSSRLGSLAAQAAGDFAGRRTSYAYRISKAAQNMLTVALAQELAGRVRCWAVHPGSLTTAMGAGDADTSSHEAAVRLGHLLDSSDTTSPRYISLEGADLRW